MYMLYTFNLTTIFYYLIPDMLNCSLVLLILKSSDFTKRFISYSRAKKSIFIIAVYFAIFSNLFCSEILGVFCFCVLVVPVYEVLNRKLSLKVFFRKYSIYLAIETLWLLSIFMEQSGGRANMIGGNKIFDFIGATQNFFRLLSSINHGVMLGIIIIGISFLCLLLKKDKVILENELLRKNIKFLSFYFFPMTLVSLLLAAKSVPGYAGIPNSMYGIFFIILLFILLALGCLIEKIYCFGIIMPLLILFSLISLMNIKPIIYSNTSNFMPQICVEVDRALINQFIDADKNGENQVNIYVPKWKGTNWPHSNDTIHSLSKILYQHGILTHSIQATIIPDDDFFKTYNIRTKR